MTDANVIAAAAVSSLQEEYGPDFDRRKAAMVEIFKTRPYLVPQEAARSLTVARTALRAVYELALCQ